MTPTSGGDGCRAKKVGRIRLFRRKDQNACLSFKSCCRKGEGFSGVGNSGRGNVSRGKTLKATKRDARNTREAWAQGRPRAGRRLSRPRGGKMTVTDGGRNLFGAHKGE